MKKILIFLICILMSVSAFAKHKEKRTGIKKRDLLARIEQNTQSIDKLADITGDAKHYVYANGSLVGEALVSWPIMDSRLTRVQLSFNPDFTPSLLRKDGRFRHYPTTARAFYYLERNCQGSQIYVSAFNVEPGDFIFAPTQGTVYDINSQLYYYPANATLYRTSQAFMSYKTEHNSEICHNQPIVPGNQEILIELYRNNPDITGITDYPFPLPITFQPTIRESNPVEM